MERNPVIYFDHCPFSHKKDGHNLCDYRRETWFDSKSTETPSLHEWVGQVMRIFSY